MALLEFLWQHEQDAVLDNAAMEQLNLLVPPALVVFPELQQVLETQGDWGHVYPWSTSLGFQTPLDRHQLFCLSQHVMMLVISQTFSEIIFRSNKMQTTKKKKTKKPKKKKTNTRTMLFFTFVVFFLL